MTRPCVWGTEQEERVEPKGAAERGESDEETVLKAELGWRVDIAEL